jgi:predicted RNase H-like nuclease
MTQIAGVDGCPDGWMCIIEDTKIRALDSRIFRTFADLVRNLDAAVIAIDIPIGLTERRARECDIVARRLLGPKRGTSVFPAPIRAALGCASYPEAKGVSQQVQQKGISKQAWMIYPKIREVDDALCADSALRKRVVEVHPEVSFSAWAGAPIIAGKRTKAGAAERRRLIDRHFGLAAFDTIRGRYLKGQVADDDIADAFAALWTAERIATGEARAIPETPPTDGAGLPMRMVY